MSGALPLLAVALVAGPGIPPPDAAAVPPCLTTLARGAGLFATGNLPGVVRILAPCLQLPEAALVVGAAAAVTGQAAVAGPALERAEADPALLAVANHLAGIWSLVAGDAVAVRANFRAALKADADLFASRVGLVLVAARAGEQASARAEARRLAERPGALRSEADLALLDLHGIVAAALERATVRLGAGCGLCWRTLADLHARRAIGRRRSLAAVHWRRAQGAVEQALALDPGDREAREALARSLAAQGRQEAVVAVARRGLEADGGWAGGTTLIGASLLDLGRPAEALPLLERAAARRGGPNEWKLVGLARRELGRADALDAFARAAAAGGGAQVLSYLGQAHVAAGQWAQAKLHLRRALELEPALGSARYALASALRGLGDEAGADRELARYRDNLVASETRLGREERAANLANAAARALTSLAAGDVTAAATGLQPWASAKASPLLGLARAARAVAQGRDPAAWLDVVVDGCRARNSWLR